MKLKYLSCRRIIELIETDFRAHRDQLYKEFVGKDPGINIAVQRVSGQRWVTVRNSMLTAAILKGVRHEGANSLHTDSYSDRMQQFNGKKQKP